MSIICNNNPIFKKINITFNCPPAKRYQFAGRIVLNVSKKYSFCNRERIINKSSINQVPLPINLSPFCSIFKHILEEFVILFNENGTVTYSIPGKILKNVFQMIFNEKDLFLPLRMNNMPI